MGGWREGDLRNSSRDPPHTRRQLGRRGRGGVGGGGGGVHERRYVGAEQREPGCRGGDDFLLARNRRRY